MLLLLLKVTAGVAACRLIRAGFKDSTLVTQPVMTLSTKYLKGNLLAIAD